MSVLILSVAWDTMFRWVIIVVSFTFSIKIVIQKQTIKKHLLSLFSLQSFSNFQRTVYTHVYLIVHIILEVSSQQRKSNSGSFTDARVELNHNFSWWLERAQLEHRITGFQTLGFYSASSLRESIVNCDQLAARVVKMKKTTTWRTIEKICTAAKKNKQSYHCIQLYFQVFPSKKISIHLSLIQRGFLA